MSPTEEDALSIYLSKEALALLKKLKYPCSEKVLASATPVDREGFELTGGRFALETLAGFVAGDANHSGPGRQADLLSDIAEEIESTLTAGAYARWR
jgi:hypothetical protein